MNKEVINDIENPKDNDLISRQAALDCFTATKLKKFDFILYAREEIKKLPSVTRQTGEWIRVTDNAGHLVWECDKCGWQQRYNTNFCPDCGAKMVEPQESEEV